MSSSTIERTVGTVTPAPEVVISRVESPRPTQPRVRRLQSRRGPAGRDDRRAPRLRPELFVRFSTYGRARTTGVETQACVVAAPARWRLTDRGIAVILVTGLMVVVAAVTVVAATAFHVTGDSYAPNIMSESASR